MKQFILAHKFILLCVLCGVLFLSAVLVLILTFTGSKGVKPAVNSQVTSQVDSTNSQGEDVTNQNGETTDTDASSGSGTAGTSQANTTAGTGSNTTQPTTVTDGYQYFKDMNFEKGLRVRPIDSTGSAGILNFGDDSARSSLWTLAQHFSKYEIIGTALKTNADGSLEYANTGKMIRLFKDNGKNALRMELYADKEYAHPRQNGEGWPHILLGQDFVSYSKKKIGSFKTLNYSMDVRINYAENKMGSDYDPSLHCGQTTAYFTIQNLVGGSEDYGDYIWFGIPIFDNRKTFPEPFHLVDGGKSDATGKLIYTLGGSDFLESSYNNVNPKDGKWAHCEVDMMPYIKAAVLIGQQQGFLTHTKYEDLSVGSYNIGWEVTGTFNCSMDVKNISLIGK